MRLTCLLAMKPRITRWMCVAATRSSRICRHTRIVRWGAAHGNRVYRAADGHSGDFSRQAHLKPGSPGHFESDTVILTPPQSRL
jgi:hypothetical protein